MIPISVASLIMIGLVAWLGSGAIRHLIRHPMLTKDRLAGLLTSKDTFHRFPTDLDVPMEGQEKPLRVHVEYTYEPKLQAEMEGLFKSYGPDYGAFVAMDAKTGRVLSLVSFTRKPNVTDNLALRATFPSASVFKVVTAAAAIESRNYSANTVIPFNGQNHTLYRGNILKTNITRWTRYTTLKDAFAKSINTVFGKIGAFSVGPESLRQYADRFGFNRRIASDLPLQPSQAVIPDDAWGLAESASGFTRENTMSPLQGALIASAVVNDGAMMEPYIVRSVTTQGEQGEAIALYEAQARAVGRAVDVATANEIRSLMRETVVRGTSRGSFKRFFRGELKDLEVGGKTGSLTGKSPKGKYDWFVGYAQDPDGKNRLAVAALTVHERLWRVKSSYLARRAMETYFKDVHGH